jgi:HK97 family phage portal protein
MGILATFRARAALALANMAHKVAAPGMLKGPTNLSGVDDSRGWFSLLSTFGQYRNFQTDAVTVRDDLVIAQATVFSCMTLIANDIGKLRAMLMEQVAGIWQETASPAFSPVLRKPNRFQTWQKFAEQWVFSLLSNGNAYILKERDARRVVVAMYVMDPTRCKPLVAPDGSVYYQLQEDDLSGVFEHVPALPASEIIHDRINCIFHPLVGISPLFACGLAATKGLKIEENAARFFANQSQPGGVLTAPAEISDETAARLKQYFETRFTGENAGKVAVLGDGLKYEAMTTNAVDAQLIEQLKMSAEQICAVFHVPAYMVGAAPVPPNNNVEALRLDYYGRCLQTKIEGIENALDEGLGLGPMKDGKTLGIELDLDGLLRMDTAALTAALRDQVGAGITKPNEARRRLNLPPVEGGDTPYLQQQNYALSALAKRDASEDPFGTAKPISLPQPEPDDAAAEKAMADLCEQMVQYAKAMEMTFHVVEAAAT